MVYLFSRWSEWLNAPPAWRTSFASAKSDKLMANHEDLSVVVTAATFNRPEGLAAMLDGVEAQGIPRHALLRVVIVDNSHDANARTYVERRAVEYKWPLTYHHERRRGIAFARNRGLRDAIEGGDRYVAFIDDDERPRPDWISELLKVARETGAPAVIGAVKAAFERTPPWWIQSGQFLDITHFPDRSPINYGHTTNALVELSCVRRLNIEFPAEYGLTGGEDTVFFKAIRDSGGHTVFARNALTFEDIVPKRASFRALVKFWFRSGNTDGLIKLRSNGGGVGTWLSVVTHGVSRTAAGALGATVTAPSLLAKRIYPFTCIRVMCRGLGYLASAAGLVYEEYRNHDR
jgi:succinoglycan biosynthesis protein ExoM